MRARCQFDRRVMKSKCTPCYVGSVTKERAIFGLVGREIKGRVLLLAQKRVVCVSVGSD